MARFETETRSSARQEKTRLISRAPHVTFLHTIAGLIGAAYLFLVSKTSVVHKIAHPTYLKYRREKTPHIYGFWHNVQVFLAYAHKFQGVSIIVSQSKDGEYIAQVMKRLGLVAVRGSSSRGGEKAFREICELLARGKNVGFTPDGPRGPLQSVQGGIVAAAQISGAPIVPVTYACRRKIVFNSWDKFVVPLPFGSIVVTHGKPFYIDKNVPMEQAQDLVRKALNDNTLEAEKFLNSVPSGRLFFIGRLFHGIYTALISVFLPLTIPLAAIKYGPKRTFRFLKERFVPPAPIGGGQRRIWFHAASIGEWLALKPVLKELRYKNISDVVVTVSSPEARALVAREEPRMPVFMLPADVPWILKRWIARVNPAVVGIVETELWPNMLALLHKRLIPVLIINGRLSIKSLRGWGLVRPFSHRFLNFIKEFHVRTELDGRRYVQLGAPYDRVHITGNVKYDALTVSTPDGKGLADRKARRQARFGNTEGILLTGASTWDGEEEALISVLRKKNDHSLKLILAPRRASRFAEVAKLLEKTPLSWSLWSQVKKTHGWSTDILLVDTLGDLKELLALSDIAFVGGSLYPHGGQNPLEAASAGIPTLFGPSMENFHEEAIELKRRNAARQARHAEDLLKDIIEITGDETLRHSMGVAAANFVTSRQGASARIANRFEEFLGV